MFQYTKWPDAGSPVDPEPVLRLMATIKVTQQSKIVLPAQENIYGNAEAINEQSIERQTKPILVHCSAGVGRTGAFCALHVSMKKMDTEGKVDLFTTVKHMRTQRMSMVQTSDQYEWAYRILAAYCSDVGSAEALYENVRTEARRASLKGRRNPPLPPVPVAAPSSSTEIIQDYDEPAFVGNGFAEEGFQETLVAETSFTDSSNYDHNLEDDFDDDEGMSV